MRKATQEFLKADGGGAIHEFALVAPVLLLLMVGAMDFGRAFYHSVTVSNAAGTGAFYGAQTITKSGNANEIAQMAQDDAKDVGPVTVTSERICRCPNGSAVDCVTGTCAGYGAPRVYVKCGVRKTFDTMVNLPKVPDLFAVARDAYIRVQ